MLLIYLPLALSWIHFSRIVETCGGTCTCYAHAGLHSWSGPCVVSE